MPEQLLRAPERDVAGTVIVDCAVYRAANDKPRAVVHGGHDVVLDRRDGLHAARRVSPKIGRSRYISSKPVGDASLWKVYSGDMGNTFGPKEFSIGSRRHVSSSK